MIGNGHYPADPGLPELRGPYNDVHHLAAALVDPGIGLFDDADVEALRDPDGTEILDALRGLCARAEREDLVFVYYSGHGLPGPPESGSLRLCARDTTLATAGETAIGFPVIDAILRTSPAAVTLIVLDCCYGGAAKTAPDGRYLASSGRGRHIITACRERETTPDATSLMGMSRFTGYLVGGLRAGPDRPYAADTKVSDLFDFAYARMETDGAGGTPTQRTSFDGDPHVVIARLPAPSPVPLLSPYALDRSDPKDQSAPAWLRAVGRWALTLVLLVLGCAGAGGTQVSVDELAYRAQWPVADGADKPSAYDRFTTVEPLGSAFYEVALIGLGVICGSVLVMMLLARLMGSWWWLPASGLVVLTAYGMWEGFSFYGENTAPVFLLAAVFVGSAIRLPPSEPRSVRRTFPLVLAVAVLWYPCAYLAYNCAFYSGTSWTVDDTMTYLSLKESVAFERVFYVWLTGICGLIPGAVAAHWILARMPVLGRPRGAATRGRPLRPTRPWLRALTVWGVALTVVPTALYLAVSGYLDRPQRAFTDRAMLAMAASWIASADSCEGRECTFTRWDVTYRVTFLEADDVADAAAEMAERAADNRRKIAHRGSAEGYTYVIEEYDGHDATLSWTHEKCACYARISVHNNVRGYEDAVDDFWYHTSLTKPPS
ncbi:caspase domain-containing protein [Streptomyces sp. NPDC051018]|uniref:caspase domain-containing protein n=1 Tax=Streptomyces sp. NPDC051018 TaxID=3365639 RepID=UPI00378C3FE4